MRRLIIYVHGKDGSSEEAAHFAPLFDNCGVTGFDYTAQTPWEAKEEFPIYFDSVAQGYEFVTLIANSIGAYFAMHALSNCRIERAYFISPMVDMEKLIADMMVRANVTEYELCDKKEIQTAFGETLSWEYFCYAKQNPVVWNVPTHILYGEKDNLTSYETMLEFANKINATLTVMKNGEHWFHTEEQMQFLDKWITRFS